MKGAIKKNASSSNKLPPLGIFCEILCNPVDDHSLFQLLVLQGCVVFSKENGSL